MKTLKLNDFMSSLPTVLTDVVTNGDIVCVETDRTGSFVIMEEPEYQVMRDALEFVLTHAAEVESILARNKDRGLDPRHLNK